MAYDKNEIDPPQIQIYSFTQGFPTPEYEAGGLGRQPAAFCFPLAPLSERRGRRSLREYAQISGGACSDLAFAQGKFKAHVSFLHHPRRERCPQRSAAQIDGSRNGRKKDKIENPPKIQTFSLHKGCRHANAVTGEIRLTGGTFFLAVPYEDCTISLPVP